MTDSDFQEPPSEHTAAGERAADPSLGDRAAVALRGARVRLGAVVAILAAVGLVVWAIAGNGGDDDGSVPSAGKGTSPVAVSAAGLRTLAAALPQPIYWVGARPGRLYEFSQTADGKAYVRYLPPGAEAGDSRALPTVATYPMKDAYTTTLAAAKREDSVTLQPPNGAVAFHNAQSRTNAYVAFPDTEFQIEVFDPAPGRAAALVEQGAVTAVPTLAPKGTVTQVSVAGLKTLATALGQPIYWAGRLPGTTLELTQAASGRIYVRYLPQGVAVGDPGQYLTVGTYPFDGAYDATKGLATGKQLTQLELPGGGVAAFGKSPKTRNVYVAYPGVPVQIEVFDPTPGKARRLVASGQIVPVG